MVQASGELILTSERKPICVWSKDVDLKEQLFGYRVALQQVDEGNDYLFRATSNARVRHARSNAGTRLADTRV